MDVFTIAVVVGGGVALLRWLQVREPRRRPAEIPRELREGIEPDALVFGLGVVDARVVSRTGIVRLVDRSVVARPPPALASRKGAVVAWSLRSEKQVLAREVERGFLGNRLEEHRERTSSDAAAEGCMFVLATPNDGDYLVDARRGFRIEAPEKTLDTTSREGLATLDVLVTMLTEDAEDRVPGRRLSSHLTGSALFGRRVRLGQRVTAIGALRDPQPDDPRPLPVLQGPGLILRRE